MNVDDLTNEIRAFCLEHADDSVVRKYSHYFVEGYYAFGIAQKSMEVEHAFLFKKYRDTLGFEGFLTAGDRLIQTGKYEEASFALMFAADFSNQYTPETFERLGVWLDNGVCNWAHADMMAGSIFSHFLMKKIIAYTAFSEWRQAESKWKRRVIPVSLIKPMKNFLKINDLLDFLTPMMLMPEKVVHQGLGWFLREAWKAEPTPVETFLTEWKDSAPRLIFQYATEKMSPEQKARFKRVK